MINNNHHNSSAEPNVEDAATRARTDPDLPALPDLPTFVHCTVYDTAGITASLDRAGEDLVGIHLGDPLDPGLTLDFVEVSALLRLSEVAIDAARRLQARIDDHQQDQAADDA